MSRRAPRPIPRLLCLCLGLALGSAAPSLAQLGLDPEASRSPGTRPAQPDLPPAAVATASPPVGEERGSVTLRVRRPGRPGKPIPFSGPTPTSAVLGPDEEFEVELHGLAGEAPESILLATGTGRSAAASRIGTGGGPAVYGPLRVADLAGPRARIREAAIFQTTSSPDAETFRQTLASPPAAGRRSLPGRVVSQIREIPHEPRRGEPIDRTAHPTRRSHPHLAGRDLFEAAGVREESLVVRSPSGAELARGVLPQAGRAAWVYFSGHYPAYSGAQLHGDDLFPTGIRGAAWRDHLEVLVLASCYAVGVGAAGAHDAEPAHGWQGAAWWEKFEGTVLGYRGLGPTGTVAGEIARRFLRKVAELDPDPADRAGHSRVVARAWMWANTVGLAASDAAALDASGTYYYKLGGNSRAATDPRLAGARRHPSGWFEAPREAWRDGASRNRVAWNEFDALFRPLAEAWNQEQGGRPFTEAQARAHRAWKAGTLRLEVAEDDPTLVVRLRSLVVYEHHIFYDIHDPTRMMAAIAWLKEQRGRDPSVAEVRSFFTWPADFPRPARFPGPDAQRRVSDDEIRSLIVHSDKGTIPGSGGIMRPPP